MSELIWADEVEVDGPFPLGEPEPTGSETIVEPPTGQFVIEPSGVVDPFDYVEPAPTPARGVRTHHGRRVPWGTSMIHALGGDKYRASYAEDTVTAPSCRQALVDAGINFRADLAELVTEDVVTDLGVGPLEVGPRYAVYGSHGKVLGIVSDRYNIYQPDQLATWTDLLLERTLLSGVGLTNDGGFGARMYSVVELPEDYYPGGLPDENVKVHLLTTNSFDGSTSLRVSIIPTREICVNTMRAAMKGHVLSWSVRHTQDMEANMINAREAIQAAMGWAETMVVDAEQLLAIPVSKDTGVAIINEMIPVPEPTVVSGEITNRRTIQNRQRQRSEATAMWMRSPNLENVRMTGWGLMQGYVEWQQHGKSYRTDPLDRLVRDVQTGDGGDAAISEVREMVLAL